MASKSTRSSGKAAGKKTTSSSTRKKTTSSGKKTSANTKRKTTSTRGKTSSGKANTSKKTGSGKSGREPVSDEIILTIVLFVSAALLLSLFGLGGRVGDLAARFLFGLFGQLTYIMPFVLFIGVAFHISNRGNDLAHLKIGAFLVFLFSIMTIIAIVSQDASPVSNLKDAYSVSASTHKGGGLAGCLIGLPLYRYFGKIVSILIMTCLILVSAVLVTGKGVFIRLGRDLGRFGDWSKVKARDLADERAERRLERQQE